MITHSRSIQTSIIVKTQLSYSNLCVDSTAVDLRCRRKCNLRVKHKCECIKNGGKLLHLLDLARSPKSTVIDWTDLNHCACSFIKQQLRGGSHILANVCIHKCDNFFSGQTERCHVFIPVFVECLATSGLVIYDSCRSTQLSYFPSQHTVWRFVLNCKTSKYWCITHAFDCFMQKEPLDVASLLWCPGLPVSALTFSIFLAWLLIFVLCTCKNCVCVMLQLRKETHYIQPLYIIQSIYSTALNVYVLVLWYPTDSQCTVNAIWHFSYTKRKGGSAVYRWCQW